MTRMGSAMKGLAFFALIVILAGCAGTRTMESSGEYVDDSVITSTIKTNLVADPVTKAREIGVETFKGSVQLSGFVSTAEEKEKAGEIARKVKGVSELRNNIVVK